MYQVGLTRPAQKSLKKIPTTYQLRFKEIVKKLGSNPFSLDLKKLAPPNKTSHRLRMGDYRVFLDINTALKQIIIVDIRRRTTQTYRK